MQPNPNTDLEATQWLRSLPDKLEFEGETPRTAQLEESFAKTQRRMPVRLYAGGNTFIDLA
jgi:hypothetical protein